MEASTGSGFLVWIHRVTPARMNTYTAFSIGTFIVAPGAAPAPVVNPPNLNDASTNPPTPPVQLYHLGLWFDSPQEAAKAGCANKATPFNSIHNAGVQVLNTSNFPTLNGPLLHVNQ